MSRLVGLVSVAGWAWLIWAVDRRLRAQMVTQRSRR